MSNIYVDGARVSLEQLKELAATANRVLVSDCPGLTALPEFPAATWVLVSDCPGLTALPEFPAATWVWVSACPGLTSLPDFPAATSVWVSACPGLTSLPDFPAATSVWVSACPGLMDGPHVIVGGTDARRYQFLGLRVRGDWMVVAGCRNFTLDQAQKHWAVGGPSDRADCRALVEKIATEIRRRRKKEKKP